jgi:transposase
MDRQRSCFILTDHEALVPKDYILRKIDKAVDFSFFNRLVAPAYSADTRGRTPKEPEKVLRLILIAYLNDLSIRAVCRETMLHIGYQWFSCFLLPSDVPDHSTISKLKNEQWSKLGPDLWVETLNKIVDRCIEVGLVSGKHLATDGTSVRADASITSYEAIYPKRTVEEFVAEVEAELSAENQEDEKSSSKNPPNIEIVNKSSEEREKQTKQSDRRGEKDFHGQKITNETHRSTTDPDALLYRKAKGQETHPRYIDQNTIDLKSRVILAAGMYAAKTSSETTAALQHLDLIRDRFGFEVETLTADALYGSTSMLREMDKRGVILHAPLLADGKKEQTPVYKRNTKIPAQIEKRLQKASDIDLRNRQREIQKTKAYTISHRLRIRVEHTFAEAKEHHGLRSSRYRTLCKQQEQANLTAVVQNLKRLLSFTSRGKAGAVALAVNKTSKSLIKAVFGYNNARNWSYPISFQNLCPV